MLDILQILGAVAILIPFMWSQLGTMELNSRLYLWPNLVGSAILAVLAAHGRDWGFLLLEGTWALVAGWSLLARARGRGARPAH